MKHLLLLLILMPLTVFTQVRTFTIDSTSIPKDQKGKLVSSIGYTDKYGRHVVSFRETGIYDSREFRAAELYACQVTDTAQDWRMYDGFVDCPVDVMASFAERKPLVTDLNKDGVAEVWMIYRTVCTGDISPPLMKVIMYEGRKKFAMRGETRVNAGEMFLGGKYTFDGAFLSAPAPYRDYAKKLWAKHVNYAWQ